MRTTIPAGLLVLTVVALVNNGCGPIANKTPAGPPTYQEPTTKPDQVATNHVAMTAMTELSHIERALKPFAALQGMSDISAPAEVSGLPTQDCKTTGSTRNSLRETRWACGLDSTVRGRKEIEGVERIDYDKTTKKLTYQAKFESRNFDDLEPRDKAHTLVTSRNITIFFAADSSDKSSDDVSLLDGWAKVRMTSAAILKGAREDYRGSNWKLSFNGTLKRNGTNWVLQPLDSARPTKNPPGVTFDGVLFGLDEERKTNWASGRFTFEPDGPITFDGLGLVAACTKPLGSWKILANGGGQNLDTTLQTSSLGLKGPATGLLSWPIDLCDQP